MLHGVIMAGGSGTRFWPASRKGRPKQLLSLTGERTLIQETYDRCQPLIPPERMWVVTGELLADETARQLPQIPREQILVEPCGRNTAPCVGLAAVRLAARDPDATMLVLPADHAIQTTPQFQAGMQRAAELVESDPERLVLFGVKPSFPATGYGYIERAAALAGETSVFGVQSFREKPDQATATQYVESGRFYWNCGIFCWRAQRILDGLRRFEPEVAARLQVLSEAADSTNWSAVLATEFPKMKSISIDYAVLEKDSPLCVVEAPFGWDDVGSWLAIARLRGVDSEQNTVDGPHVGVRTTDCLVKTTADHLIATIGVEGLVIVHTPHATLVARKGDEDGIRKIVERLGTGEWNRYQ